MMIIVGASNFTKGDSWDLYLSYINSVHNNKWSRRTKLCPNEIMMRRKFSLPIDFTLNNNAKMILYDHFLCNQVS